MKKSILFTLAIAITTIGLILFGAQTVTANRVQLASNPLIFPTSTSSADEGTEKDAGPANKSWVIESDSATGQEISTAKVTAPPPNEWSRLQSKGLVVSGQTPICHPFRGGQFGWHTSVFLLNGSTWLEIPTTVEWYPDEEGQLMACAFAPVSGTYALFGYWEWFDGFEKPVEPTIELPESVQNDLPL